MQRGHFREIEAAPDNADAELVAACASAKAAIIVYGKRIGTTITVFTDNECPTHDPRAAARQAENPAPVMAPPLPAETEEEAEQRKAAYEQERDEYEAEQKRQNEERSQQFEREQKEREAEEAKRDKLREQRRATFERIVANAPATLTASQLRVILRALVNLDPYTFADDLAEDIADENDQRSTGEILLSVIDGTTDNKLTGFAVHLALSGHRDIPCENECDFLFEAEAAFVPPQPKKAAANKKRKQPTPIERDAPATKPKKAAAKKTRAA